MESDAVRRYAQGPWRELEQAKQRFWAEEFAARGPDATLCASQALWVHMRAVRADWPDDGQRDDDLVHHAELKSQLDRAGRALADR